MGDMFERIRPGHALERSLAADHGMEQPVLDAKRLGERQALGAEPAEIRRVLAVARDRGAALAVRRRQHAAADPAVGTGGAGGESCGILLRHDETAHAALEDSASARPNMIALRMVATGSRLLIMSRYQSASATSPISTAPVR